MAVLALLVLLAPPVAGGRGAGCAAQCATAFVDALEQDPACGACATGAAATRAACRDTVTSTTDCVETCSPGVAGRCTLALECVQECRDAETSALSGCEARFQHEVQARCPGGRHCWAAARKVRRICLRDCRRGGGTPAVPTLVAPASTGGCNCLGSCVRDVVGSCYEDCADRCDGDPDALSICRWACRNRECNELRDRCTPDGAHAKAFAACCARCGTCESPALTCKQTVEPTTTTTTVAVATTTTTSLPTCTGATGTVCGSCGSGECCGGDAGCTHDGGPVCFTPLVCGATTCTSDAECTGGNACVRLSTGTFCCAPCR